MSCSLPRIISIVSLGIQLFFVIGDSLLIIYQSRKRVDLEDRIAGRIKKHINGILQQIPDDKSMHVHQENNKIADKLLNNVALMVRGHMVPNGGQLTTHWLP